MSLSNFSTSAGKRVSFSEDLWSVEGNVSSSPPPAPPSGPRSRRPAFSPVPPSWEKARPRVNSVPVWIPNTPRAGLPNIKSVVATTLTGLQRRGPAEHWTPPPPPGGFGCHKCTITITRYYCEAGGNH